MTFFSFRELPIQELKLKILSESIKEVPKLGWSKENLGVGTHKFGLSPISHGIFELGAVDLIFHFVDQCNREMIEIVKKTDISKFVQIFCSNVVD